MKARHKRAADTARVCSLDGRIPRTVLVNRTRFSSAWLTCVIKAVTPPGVRDFVITFQYGPDHEGGAEEDVRKYPEVNIVLNPKARYPYRWTGGGGYLPSVNRNPREAVVMLVAHEMRHLWQRRYPRAARLPGSWGRISERDADLYAIAMLDAYRCNLLEGL